MEFRLLNEHGGYEIKLNYYFIFIIYIYNIEDTHHSMVVMNVMYTKNMCIYVFNIQVFFSFFGWACISTGNGSALRIPAFVFLADDFDDCPGII